MIVKVSIVTICYNEASNIAATMQSVVEQAYRNIEYIVKDGGSTDGTVDIIKEFEQNHRSTFNLQPSLSAGKARRTADYTGG